MEDHVRIHIYTVVMKMDVLEVVVQSWSKNNGKFCGESIQRVVY